MREAHVLLPALATLHGDLAQNLQLAKWLGRADHLERAAAGREAQLHRVFRVLPKRIAAAPLTRRLDSNDAYLGGWSRCDPAHVRADGTTARLFAYGERLQITPAEADALVTSLRVLFGDMGVPISAPHPSRWYVAVAEPRALPTMHAPEDVLGGDLLEFLPEGNEGRRWRQLWNEAQVILHQHPVNAERAAAGKPPVNSVWFWGGGVLPDSVQGSAKGVLSVDPLVQSLAALQGSETLSGNAPWQPDALIDLFHLRELAALEQQVMPEVQAALRKGAIDSLVLDFADGQRFRVSAGQRWRFWWRAISAWTA